MYCIGETMSYKPFISTQLAQLHTLLGDFLFSFNQNWTTSSNSQHRLTEKIIYRDFTTTSQPQRDVIERCSCTASVTTQNAVWYTHKITGTGETEGWEGEDHGETNWSAVKHYNEWPNQWWQYYGRRLLTDGMIQNNTQAPDSGISVFSIRCFLPTGHVISCMH